jgi:hypothetical protein
MKHFINILGLLILVFFSIGVAYLQTSNVEQVWGMLYLPICLFILLWGIKIDNNYKND